ncbi:ABC transporter substrate-binding protein [Corynebacterium sp. H128]|uniref:ABC transporter substrate-binding protein n=1 Tax=unclassified Corynebacterium TaxID=2624378 RepID=UPI00309CD858
MRSNSKEFMFGWKAFVRGTQQRARRRATVAALTVAATTLASCTQGLPGAAIDHFGYAVGSPLLTTNAQTIVGASTNSDLLGGKLFPPVFITGPNGQMIPNRDLATAQLLPGAHTQVVYTINAEAQYSDEKPITCTDFLLAYKAGANPSLFDSNAPLMTQVEKLDCEPGAKKFTVTFKENMGARWRQLFGPGTVVPAHAVGHRLGLDEQKLVSLLQANNPAALMPVATVWNQGFSLKEFDPELQVSAGPYRIESVGESGEVQLVRNENFHGDSANLERIMVWPQNADLNAANETGSLEIADLVGVKDVPWVNRDDPRNRFKVEYAAGHMTELLSLANVGVFADAESRRAFAACINRSDIAAISSAESGVEVTPVATRLTTATDPVNTQLKSLIEEKNNTDLGQAERLRGQTIRIGYTGPDPRKQAMVAAIASSCAPAGINVVDASSEGASLGDVGRMEDYPGGQREFAGELDAFLYAVDPHQGYGHVDGGLDDVEKLRATEQQLWDESDTVPLAAQPRTIVYDNRIANVVPNTSSSGIGWNMERWVEGKSK